MKLTQPGVPAIVQLRNDPVVSWNGGTYTTVTRMVLDKDLIYTGIAKHLPTQGTEFPVSAPGLRAGWVRSPDQYSRTLAQYSLRNSLLVHEPQHILDHLTTLEMILIWQTGDPSLSPSSFPFPSSHFINRAHVLLSLSTRMEESSGAYTKGFKIRNRNLFTFLSWMRGGEHSGKYLPFLPMNFYPKGWAGGTFCKMASYI